MLDKLLYLYSTIFITIIVVGSVLSANKGPSALVIGLLFAPVAFYLIYSFVKYVTCKKSTTPASDTPALQAILDRNRHHLTRDSSSAPISRFSAAKSSPLFLVTLVLLSFAAGSLLIRSLVDDTTPHQIDFLKLL
jgi:hypothetical protein